MPDRRFYFFASVPTGLESIALDELRVRVSPERAESRRSKIVFATDRSFESLCSLRTVFRFFAWVGEVNHVPLDETGLNVIRDVIGQLDWSPALGAWREQHPDAPEQPTFRATIRRTGEHAYTSMDAAGAVGAGVQRRFGWPVNLNEPQLEVFGQLVDQHLLLGITMTPRSLHRERGIKSGRAGLKGPIAAALVRLTNPLPGEVTLDPMCGVGTISIEAAHLQPNGRHLASDIDASDLTIAHENTRAAGVSVELHQWDARDLPLEEASVDVVICDLPFGRRVSSPVKNQHLYPPVLSEMARVLKPGGRAVLLTLEKRLLNRLLNRDSRWTLREQRRVYYGGLGPMVFLLDRT